MFLVVNLRCTKLNTRYTAAIYMFLDLRLIWMPFQIYHYVRPCPGSRCAKFD